MAYRGTVPETPALSNAERHKILLVLLSALFMSLMTVSIVNVALPSIREGLDASDSQLQWVLSGYTLTFGMTLVAAGRAGDIFGRDRLFVAGAGLFAFAALLCAVAPNAIFLNVARAILGVGSGLLNPQVTGLIHQHYEGAEKARAFGMFGATVGASVAVGPILGGMLITWLPEGWGWRATLGINVPVALLAVVLALRWLPRTARRAPGEPRQPHDLDPIGALLLGACVLVTMLPFIIAGQHPWAWWLIAVGIALAALWLWWEKWYKKRGRSPMVDLNLFRIRSFTLGAAMITAYFAGSTTVWVLIAQFVQDGLGKTAVVAGLISLPAALMTVVSAPIGGRLVVVWGRWLVVAGICLQVLGVLLLAWLTGNVDDGAPIWLLSLAGMPVGFAAGWVVSPNQTLSLRKVPVESGGTAGGIMQTGQRMATSMGTAAVTGIFFYTLESAGYALALDRAYSLVIGFSVVALVIAVADAIAGRDEPVAVRR